MERKYKRSNYGQNGDEETEEKAILDGYIRVRMTVDDGCRRQKRNIVEAFQHQLVIIVDVRRNGIAGCIRYIRYDTYIHTVVPHHNYFCCAAIDSFLTGPFFFFLILIEYKAIVWFLSGQLFKQLQTPCLAVSNWPLLPALPATSQFRPELCANTPPPPPRRPPCLPPLPSLLAISSRLPT